MVQFLQLDSFLRKSKSDAPSTDLGFSPKAGPAGALRATSQRLPPRQHCLTPEKEPQLLEEVVVKVAATEAEECRASQWVAKEAGHAPIVMPLILIVQCPWGKVQGESMCS